MKIRQEPLSFTNWIPVAQLWKYEERRYSCVNEKIIFLLLLFHASKNELKNFIFFFFLALSHTSKNEMRNSQYIDKTVTNIYMTI